MFRFSYNNKCSGSPVITNVSCESESSLRLFWRKPKVKDSSVTLVLPSLNLITITVQINLSVGRKVVELSPAAG